MRMTLLICLVCWANIAMAAQATLVHVSIGKVSQVSFPENIAKVVKGGAPDSVLVEAMDNMLYILPKINTPADLFVTGISGTSYPLNLKISQNHDLDVVVGTGKANSFKGSFNVMDLMKDVLLGNEPVGSTTIKVNRTIKMKDVPLELNIKTAYDFPTVTVYVLTARNLINNMVVVPVEQITLGKTLAIASQADTLTPNGQEGDQTNIYLITAK